VRVINKSRLIQLPKKRERISYLNQVLSGLEKNTSRMKEDDGRYFFNY
jgi:hypothetical protein